MHLDLFLRGKIEFVSVWESHVQAQYFKLRKKNIENGEESCVGVQLGLRKGIFGSYELIFPKEALAEVLSILGIYKPVSYAALKSSKYKHFVMRVLFGDKPVPKKVWKEVQELKEKQNILIDNRERMLSNCIVPGVSVHLIGIKNDNYGTVDNIDNHERL